MIHKAVCHDLCTVSRYVSIDYSSGMDRRDGRMHVPTSVCHDSVLQERPSNTGVMSHALLSRPKDRKLSKATSNVSDLQTSLRSTLVTGASKVKLRS
jgi:hypothetical protein